MWRRSSIQSLSPGVFCCFKFSKLPPIKSCPESASGLRNDGGVCACVSIVIEYIGARYMCNYFFSCENKSLCVLHSCIHVCTSSMHACFVICISLNKMP